MTLMQPFSRGQWIQWSTEFSVKRGQVVLTSGPSIVVEWLGGERQVFPVVEGYVYGPYASSSRMELIERPREASRIEREQKRGVMSVARAAAILGTTPKQIRAKLRAGTLQGRQTEGKWTHVEL